MIYLNLQCKRSARLITPRQVKYTTHSACRPRETWLLEFSQNGNLTVFTKHAKPALLQCGKPDFYCVCSQAC